MNPFKKALIDPSGPMSEPKTHSFTPVVADTQNFFQEFMNRIMQIGATLPGWGGYNVNNFYGNGMITLSCVCPHGQSAEVTLSADLMMNAPKYGGGAAMADDAFSRLNHVCQSQHANIPPPGSFVYSLGSQEPLGYQTYSNYMQIEDYKKQYLAEYDKQMSQELLYDKYTYTYEYYGYIPTYSYGGYGSGTTSILSELLSICPGLGTVRRPCPDKSGCEYTDASLPLSNLIPHVNDNHRWSREKIAEWLDIIAIDDPSVDLTIKPAKPTKEEKRAKPSISPTAQEIAKYYGPVTLAGNTIVKI